jgi:ubiquinone/menaquinone biosynthesis C-methylase UbiE
MKLNALEFSLMNNPIREWSQWVLETPRMFGDDNTLTGQNVLEVGCGRGVGVEILMALGANEVTAFDLDEKMVELARQRTARFGGHVHIFSGDAEIISAPDASFDSVADYGILHHVPHWQTAIAEIARVLKPGSSFYFEEVLEGLIANPLATRTLVHPESGRFSAEDFRTALEAAGLKVVRWSKFVNLGIFGQALKEKT